MTKYLNPKYLITIGLLFAFLVNSVGLQPVFAQDLVLPAPGTMVHLSPIFNPPILKGIKVNPANPFRFEFVLDKGDASTSSAQVLKKESSRLIKYFLASLTISEKDLWVNLSPYEKDRIVPDAFGKTEMGRDLLAQDYMLKQITASLIYPEDEVGKKFWKRIYEEAAKKFGTTNIPVNTFNKVWIVPEKAVVYENAKAGTAYVVESKLKVMLEQDYLALQKSTTDISQPKQSLNETSTIGSQIVREIIIPQLTKEINTGSNFTKLRQVYNSLILATWYKKKIKDSILSQVYSNKNKTSGVNIDDPQEKQKIYERYLQAFKKGAYNFIKEEIDPVTRQTIPRKYFSGGCNFLTLKDDAMITINHVDARTFDKEKELEVISGDFSPFKDRAMTTRSEYASLLKIIKERKKAVLDISRTKQITPLEAYLELLNPNDSLQVSKAINTLGKTREFFLELGCGDGKNTAELARHNVGTYVLGTDSYDIHSEYDDYEETAIDFSKKRLLSQIMMGKNNAEYNLLRAHADIILYLPDQSIDALVLVRTVPELWDDLIVLSRNFDIGNKFKKNAQIPIVMSAASSDYGALIRSIMSIKRMSEKPIFRGVDLHLNSEYTGGGDFLMGSLKQDAVRQIEIPADDAVRTYNLSLSETISVISRIYDNDVISRFFRLDKQGQGMPQRWKLQRLASILGPHIVQVARNSGLKKGQFMALIKGEQGTFPDDLRVQLMEPLSKEGLIAEIVDVNQVDHKFFRKYLKERIEQTILRGDPKKIRVVLGGTGFDESKSVLMDISDTLREAASRHGVEDINAWISGWDVAVKGYSIETDNLIDIDSKMETQDVPYHQRWLSLEYIDLMNQRDLQRIESEKPDVIFAVCSLYFEEIRENEIRPGSRNAADMALRKASLDRLIGALNEGGLFVNEYPSGKEEELSTSLIPVSPLLGMEKRPGFYVKSNDLTYPLTFLSSTENSEIENLLYWAQEHYFHGELRQAAAKTFTAFARYATQPYGTPVRFSLNDVLMYLNAYLQQADVNDPFRVEMEFLRSHLSLVRIIDPLKRTTNLREVLAGINNLPRVSEIEKIAEGDLLARQKAAILRISDWGIEMVMHNWFKNGERKIYSRAAWKPAIDNLFHALLMIWGTMDQPRAVLLSRAWRKNEFMRYLSRKTPSSKKRLSEINEIMKTEPGVNWIAVVETERKDRGLERLLLKNFVERYGERNPIAINLEYRASAGQEDLEQLKGEVIDLGFKQIESTDIYFRPTSNMAMNATKKDQTREAAAMRGKQVTDAAMVLNPDPVVEHANFVTAAEGKQTDDIVRRLFGLGLLSNSFKGTFVLVGIGYTVENLKVLASQLPQAKILGLDYDTGVVNRGKELISQLSDSEKLRITVEQANARNLGGILEDRSVGAMYFEHVFSLYSQFDDQHQKLLEDMVREAYRVLKPGGILVINDAFIDYGFLGLASDKIINELGFEKYRSPSRSLILRRVDAAMTGAVSMSRRRFIQLGTAAGAVGKGSLTQEGSLESLPETISLSPEKVVDLYLANISNLEPIIGELQEFPVHTLARAYSKPSLHEFIDEHNNPIEVLEDISWMDEGEIPYAADENSPSADELKALLEFFQSDPTGEHFQAFLKSPSVRDFILHRIYPKYTEERLSDHLALLSPSPEVPRDWSKIPEEQREITYAKVARNLFESIPDFIGPVYDKARGYPALIDAVRHDPHYWKFAAPLADSLKRGVVALEESAFFQWYKKKYGEPRENLKEEWLELIHKNRNGLATKEEYEAYFKKQRALENAWKAQLEEWAGEAKMSTVARVAGRLKEGVVKIGKSAANQAKRKLNLNRDATKLEPVPAAAISHDSSPTDINLSPDTAIKEDDLVPRKDGSDGDAAMNADDQARWEGINNQFAYRKSSIVSLERIFGKQMLVESYRHDAEFFTEAISIMGRNERTFDLVKSLLDEKNNLSRVINNAFIYFPNFLADVLSMFAKDQESSSLLVGIIDSHESLVNINSWLEGQHRAAPGLVLQSYNPATLNASVGMSRLLARLKFPEDKKYYDGQELLLERRFGTDNFQIRNTPLPGDIYIQYDDRSFKRSDNRPTFAFYPLKADLEIQRSPENLRASMGITPGRKVVMAVSLDAGETLVVLRQFKKFYSNTSSSERPLLIIAPSEFNDDSKNSLVTEFGKDEDFKIGVRSSDDQVNTRHFYAQGQPIGDFDAVVLKTQGEVVKISPIANLAVLQADRNLGEFISSGVGVLVLDGLMDKNADQTAYFKSKGAVFIVRRQSLMEQMKYHLSHSDELAQKAKLAYGDFQRDVVPAFQFLVSIALFDIIRKQSNPAMAASPVDAAMTRDGGNDGEIGNGEEEKSSRGKIDFEWLKLHRKTLGLTLSEFLNGIYPLTGNQSLRIMDLGSAEQGLEVNFLGDLMTENSGLKVQAAYALNQKGLFKYKGERSDSSRSRDRYISETIELGAPDTITQKYSPSKKFDIIFLNAPNDSTEAYQEYAAEAKEFASKEALVLVRMSFLNSNDREGRMRRVFREEGFAYRGVVTHPPIGYPLTNWVAGPFSKAGTTIFVFSKRDAAMNVSITEKITEAAKIQGISELIKVVYRKMPGTEKVKAVLRYRVNGHAHNISLTPEQIEQILSLAPESAQFDSGLPVEIAFDTNVIKWAGDAYIEQLISVGTIRGEQINPQGYANTKDLTTPRDYFGKVIAVVASTGGWDAMEKMIPNLPQNHPPIVISEHQHPDYMPQEFLSVMQSVKSRVINCRLAQIYYLKPGVVYLGRNLYIGRDSSGRPYLVNYASYDFLNRNYKQKLRKYGFNDAEISKLVWEWSGDTLFITLARNFMKDAVAVVLSGMGIDGSKGAVEIAKNGGAVIVQDGGDTRTFVTVMPSTVKEAGIHVLSATAAKIPLLFDTAMTVGKGTVSPKTMDPGGIDLTSDKALTVQNNGQAIKFHLDPAQMVQWQNAPGVTFDIIDMQPMINIRVWLGLTQENLR